MADTSYLCRMIQEKFQFYKPCKLLQPYVKYYWVFRIDQPLNTITFPIGCPQIIFHKQAPLYIPERNTAQDKPTISGQVNFSSHLCTDGNTEMIVIVFQSHALRAFLSVPASLFYNQEVSGYSLENKGLNELAAWVSECENNSLCVGHIERWLSARIAEDISDVLYNIKRIEATIMQIYVAPQIPATELSSTACLSKKQFERLFNSLAGPHPKEYSRIVRFQKALKETQCRHQTGKEINQAQIAYAIGYADQSHFIREFKKFCEYTPKSLLKISKPYSDLFTHPV